MNHHRGITYSIPYLYIYHPWQEIRFVAAIIILSWYQILHFGFALGSQLYRFLSAQEINNRNNGDIIVKRHHRSPGGGECEWFDSTQVETHDASPPAQGIVDTAVSQLEDSADATGGSANNTSKDESNVQEAPNNPAPADVWTPRDITKSYLSITHNMVDRSKHEHAILAISAKYYRNRHLIFIFFPLEMLVSFNILNFIRLM